MNAPQDEWAGPMAKRLVDAFRTSDLTFIHVETGTYDPTTGTIPLTETPVPSAGAVVKSRQVERDGTEQYHEVIAWIDHETVPWPVSTQDRLQYLGRRWKVVEIGPTYGSGTGQGSDVTYLGTLDGLILSTLNGALFVIQSPSIGPQQPTMYASKIIARAE